MTGALCRNKTAELSRWVIFRVDGSHRIGLGHVMRCIALAEGFEKNGIKSLFIIRDYQPEIFKIIRNNSFIIKIIPKENTFKEDVKVTLGFANRYHTKIIILDINNPITMVDLEGYKNYIQTLNRNNLYLIIIGGLQEKRILSGIFLSSGTVIIPYFNAGRIRKTNGVSYLLGPDYFIFRDDFIKAAKRKRPIVSKAKNVLVTMGGSDPFRLTVKTVKDLVDFCKSSLNLKIAIGPVFDVSIKSDIEKILENYKGNYKLIADSNNMAGLMFWADLVITSGGLTRYEAALIGTPTIVISYDDYQEKIMNDFKKCGCILHLGQAKNVGMGDIGRKVTGLLANSHIRDKMSKKGKALVDGRGVERIISNITKEALL